jgi:predicted RNase H-like HicB family nuclease
MAHDSRQHLAFSVGSVFGMLRDRRWKAQAGTLFEHKYNSYEETELGRQFDVVIERDEDGLYVASVPQIPGCHTQAQSLDALMVRIREAILLCLEAQGAPPHDLEFIGVQRVTIAA